jgi:hypothetical protein
MVRLMQGSEEDGPEITAMSSVGNLVPAAGDVWGVLSGAGAPEFLDQYTEESIIYMKNIERELGLL